MAVRIHQLAKQLDMENKELLELLVSRGFAVKSVSSTIDNISAESLIEEFAKKDDSAKEEEAAEEKAAPSAKPKLPTGAIVKSADDIAKERAAREEASRPAKPIIPSAPLRPANPGVRSAPPAVKLPTQPNRPPVVPGVRPAAGAPPMPKGPGVPPIVKLPTQNAAKSPPPIPQKNTPPSVATPAAVTPAPEQPTGELTPMQAKPPIVVRDFATLLGQKPFKLISSLMEMGVFASMNQILEPELAIELAKKFGVALEIKQRGSAANATPPKKKEAPKVDEALLMEERPPVVCILGHVDHGKTTLIDYIRKANVVAGEAGGITQHIGAYQIEFNDKKITFLDTPGHSAFEKMRERGANSTDIAVLVVAADDGFKPQTDEALKHCRKAGIPVVVAINKMDLATANPDNVKKDMQQRNLLPEDWGGETITVPISAAKGEGVDTLLEMLLLQAEMLELQANPKRGADGIVVESKLEQGRGPTATVIVQRGTLKTGDSIVCGGAYCRVRSMLNERDETLKSAPPSTPVRILGWSEAPVVGEHFKTFKNDREAKRTAEDNADAIKKAEVAAAAQAAPSNAAELLAQISAQKTKTLPVIVKADVSGSLEAVLDALKAIKSDKVELNIVTSSVGAIAPGDVEIANTAEATLVAFNTRQENGVAAKLKQHGVSLISHNIIYELVNQVKEAMAELLDPIPQEHSLGRAEIREVFKLTKGTIAGCMVTDGSVFRDKPAKLWRGKDLVSTGRITQLKRMKDDATEVKSGYECGIHLGGGINEFQQGDEIECYEIKHVKQSL